MTFYGVIFYLLAIVVLVSTLLAITRRQVVHAVVYLILSFVTTALLFYLLGAPFLAVLEVMIYAGAIMVLFLFVVMTVRLEPQEGTKGETLRQWLPAIVLSFISFSVGGILIFETPTSRLVLNTAVATPMAFGHYLFKSYWFPVEIVSFLLLIGLVGALYLGRQESKPSREKGENPS
ncbi:MAG TPA: NADH-quinone oxidoreductase subunit J [Thermodesulfobacteriota bacterium]|nr:NADH-quinone oxidoreductase subunit J [Thermodesulfobacteriota bacterium]